MTKNGMKLAAAIFLITAPHTSSAQAVNASSMTTADLLTSCRRAANVLQLDCAGYIMGVYDQMAFSGLICPPGNPTGGTGQAVAIALKYVNDHPERWHLHPSYLLGESFKAAFPCRNSN